jgi:hypothetical protein
MMHRADYSIGEGLNGLPLHSEGQLIAAGNCLDGDVVLCDTSCKQLFLSTRDERVNDFRVPSGMDNRDTKSRTYSVQSTMVSFGDFEGQVDLPSWVCAAPGPLMDAIVNREVEYKRTWG